MPVYLFTYHAYGSWLPDRPQGFVQRGQGIQPTNTKLASAYREAMTHPPVEFNHDMLQCLIEKLIAVCMGDGYRLHGTATESSHLHTLVSWQDVGTRWSKVCGRIKNLLSLSLSRRAGTTGRPWFVQGASRKRVHKPSHFDYLMQTYLPRHRGLQWYETVGWRNLEC